MSLQNVSLFLTLANIALSHLKVWLIKNNVASEFKNVSRIFLIVCFATLTTACGNDLKSTTLSVGLLNEPYSDFFSVDDAGFWTWSDSTIISASGGSLPPGIGISSNGQIFGTPTLVGSYWFGVTAWTIDQDWDDEDDVYTDREWFNLFITEPSTHPDCPNPTDESFSDVFLCTGSLAYETLAAEETFILDVTYYVNNLRGTAVNTRELDFTIYYNAEFFEPDTDRLNSLSLREAATLTNTHATFTVVAPGELNVHLEVVEGEIALTKPGRLLDLRFTALANVPAGEYLFDIVAQDIRAADGYFPETVIGSIIVANDIEIEEEVPVETEPTEDPADLDL